MYCSVGTECASFSRGGAGRRDVAVHGRQCQSLSDIECEGLHCDLQKPVSDIARNSKHKDNGVWVRGRRFRPTFRIAVNATPAQMSAVNSVLRKRVRGGELNH